MTTSLSDALLHILENEKYRALNRNECELHYTHVQIQ